MTVDEYLAWASANGLEGRFELVDGRVVEMAAERALHTVTKGRVFLTLTSAIQAAAVDCTVLTDGMTVPVASMTGRVPDALVVKGRIANETMKVEDPLIVVEVLSPGSIKVDRETKLAEYAGVASIEHYLIVDAGARQITHHRRVDAGNFAAATTSSGALDLTPPGITIAVADMLPPDPEKL
ncbi:MAG: Uma2 family endonuclease [Pseudomonadota bacterium]